MLTSVVAGLSILIIGDSHLTVPHYLIDTLHMRLERQGAQVHTAGVCGANPGDWLQAVKGTCGGAERIGKDPVTVKDMNAATYPIAQLLAKDKPDLLVIVMGDTTAAYTKDVFPKAWAWQQVTSLTQAVAKTGTACVWVGPAWGTEGGKYHKTFARVKLMSAFLGANVQPCTYIDSLELSKPGEWATVDGMHFTRAGYEAWGQALTQRLLESSVVKGLERK